MTLSIGQLAYGPVADRFGRRIPLLFGVTLFTLASLACAFAPNLDWLIGEWQIKELEKASKRKDIKVLSLYEDETVKAFGDELIQILSK